MPGFSRYLGLLVSLLLVAGPAAAAGPEPRPALNDLVEAYYEEFLRLNPVMATYNGDHRFDDRFTVNITAEHRREALEVERRFLRQVEAIAPEKLDASERLTRELFLHARRLAIEADAYPFHLVPVDQFQSTPVVFAMLGAGGSIQPFRTAKDYDNWLARIEGWGSWVDQAIANMREGMKRGIVQPRILMERTLPLLEAHIVDDPRESVFWKPIANMPESIGAEDRQRLERRFAEAIPGHVVAPYRKLREFIRDTYLPATRDTVGLSKLPGGKEWYRFLVRAQTSTEMTPTEIHRIGLAEVERLEREIATAGEREWAEPVAKYGPLLDGYRGLRSHVEAKLPALFERIPEAGFEVRPVESFRRGSAAGASYTPGAPDGSRPGVFYVNAGESARGVPSEALFLHEAVPGHHFQISLQRELGELPRFRRFGHYTAFVEGWALYVEGLGEDLGLYRDRDQYVRALRSELFRARRLVVDTGLHALGWSRRRAIDYIGSVNEVDRYIAMPGQALAYKMGQMRIRQLRERAEKRLGKRFDIRAFHRVVLEGGAMPLDVLERRVDGWIAEHARSPGSTTDVR